MNLFLKCFFRIVILLSKIGPCVVCKNECKALYSDEARAAFLLKLLNCMVSDQSIVSDAELLKAAIFAQLVARL